MINREKAFAGMRANVFGGFMSQETVNGINAILDEWERRRLSDLRWLANGLGTVRRECGVGMQPVSENLNYSAEGLLKTFPRYFSPDKARAYARQPMRIANRAYANRMGNGPESSGDGWRYRGRGLVQITGRDNYRKFGIESDPDAALKPDVAARIMWDGMINGMFTGKALSHFFNAHGEDWINARRIINGLDHATEIAGYSKAFYAALKAASQAADVPKPSDFPAPAKPSSGWAGVFSRLFGRSA